MILLPGLRKSRGAASCLPSIAKWDEAGERERKERLGNRFEEQRKKEKVAGQRWQLTKHIKETIGPLNGSLFFSIGITVGTRFREIQTAAQQNFRFSVATNWKRYQINRALKELGDLRDDLAREYDRLEDLTIAFEADNLARIAKWANDQASDEVKLQAALENRKIERFYDRYVTSGCSIVEKNYWNSDFGVSFCSTYRAPKRTLLATLTEAISLNYEPH